MKKGVRRRAPVRRPVPTPPAAIEVFEAAPELVEAPFEAVEAPLPLSDPEPLFASRVPLPLPERPRPTFRRAIFLDVENTSRAQHLAHVIDHLALDHATWQTELVAVANWRVVGHEAARLVAQRGAYLVHSAPSTGVRDWSDLRIAVAAGLWLAGARPGDAIEIVSDDRAFDAVGDVAASLGITFQRLSYRRLVKEEAPEIVPPVPSAPPPSDGSAESRGRRRRWRGGRSRGGSAGRSQPEPRSQPRSESQPELRSQPRSESQPEPRSQPRSGSRPEPRSQPRSGSRPEPRSQPRSGPRPEPRPEPQVESRESGLESRPAPANVSSRAPARAPYPPPEFREASRAGSLRESAEAERAEPHTAPHDEIVSVVRELVEHSPDVRVSIDTLANALKARGFRRPPGSPRLMTRLRRIRQIVVSPTGMITLAGPLPGTPAGDGLGGSVGEGVAGSDGPGDAADDVLESEDEEPSTEPAPQAASGQSRRRRRRRRGGRGGRRPPAPAAPVA